MGGFLGGDEFAHGGIGAEVGDGREGDAGVGEAGGEHGGVGVLEVLLHGEEIFIDGGFLEG